MPLALERQDGVDDVLEQPRPGERALLGDVPDEHHRHATALGLDDLPAVYSQMVRSITTGQPMGMAVLDRTNVSATQDLPPRRVFTEGYWYARLGYGSLFGQSPQGGAAFGFGYRAVFNRLGLDLSFFNGQVNDRSGYYAEGSSAWSLIKLQGLYFLSPTANRSASSIALRSP